MTGRIAVIVLSLLAAACGGGPTATLPALGGGPSTPAGGGGPTAGTGQLPVSGSRVRVVNLFADPSGGHELDVYGFGGSEISSDRVLVGTVGYGQVTDWFDPGFISGSSGGRTVSIAVYRKGEQQQLAGMSDTSVDPGVWATVIVQPPDTFGVGLRMTFDKRPETNRADVPSTTPGNALLVTSSEGLADAERAKDVFYASVGDFCLPGKFSDPAIEKILGHPAPQPIGSELVVKPGSHTLTIHAAPTNAGDVASCKDTPLANAPLQAASGDRIYVFLYATPGQPDLRLLLVPLAA
jgi:hypothetical protein